MPINNKYSLRDILDKNCTKFKLALINDGLIYRGFSGDAMSKKENVIIDSSTGIRTSADGFGIYNHLFSMSKNMKAYPKRDRSFICTTAANTALVYGSMYIMVPFDDVKNIAVSNESDIWNTQLELDSNSAAFATVHNFDIRISHAIRDMLGETNQTLKDKMFDIKNIEERLGKISPNKLASSLWFFDTEFVEHNHKKILTAIANRYFIPNKMGLSLVKYGTKLPKRVEVWFSGKSVCIHVSHMTELIKSYIDDGVDVSSSIISSYGIKKT